MEKTLAQKIEALKTVEQEVKNHPLCLRFIDEPHYYRVLFPHNVKGIDGIRVAKNNQKAVSLERLLEKLEKFWRLDNPFLYPDENS